MYSNLGHQLRTGGDLLPVTDSQTSDGLQQIFASNLFGHFVLVCIHVFVAHASRTNVYAYVCVLCVMLEVDVVDEQLSTTDSLIPFSLHIHTLA